MKKVTTNLKLHDCQPRLDSFREEVLWGLRRRRKRLPCKLFYDDVGSQLFEQICDLDEYYLTRCEMEILQRHAAEMATLLGPRCRLLEYGSGSGWKVRLLLDHLDNPAAYAPIDISPEPLMRSAEKLAAAYPQVLVLPVCADYTVPFELPFIDRLAGRTIAFFAGSTIGNFTLTEAKAFLRAVAATCGPEGGLLIGVDLKKDARVLHAAYNDRRGVTAAFNRNVLARINRELGADLQLDQFIHQAQYNARLGRIEMRLVSRTNQAVKLGDTAIQFRAGESILTECSYKYSLADFARLVEPAGFEVRRVWTDERQWFSLQYLTVR